MCIKIQLDQSMHSHIMAENVKCVKRRRRKNKEIKTKFCLLVSRDWLVATICFKIGMWHC